jgi:hypothetical protein
MKTAKTGLVYKYIMPLLYSTLAVAPYVMHRTRLSSFNHASPDAQRFSTIHTLKCLVTALYKHIYSQSDTLDCVAAACTHFIDE